MRKARDNPWYRLATLHGEPSRRRDEIAVKNRITWNRWMAPRIRADRKTTLLEKGWTDEELTPFTDDELRPIKASTGLLTSEDDDFTIDFSNTEFEVPLFASRFIFLSANFENATFTGLALFRSATFTGFARFKNATFTIGVDFESATFVDLARFESATFALAVFESARFAGPAIFESARFAGPAIFESATFTARAGFERATFADRADFENATFTGPAIFRSATFAASADFVNAKMKNATTFDDVTFARPPQCFNTKLHEGTTWHGVRWPAPPQDATLAREFIDAYERLKLEMDKLKKHGDELDFFALEQQCRRVVLGRWQGLPIAIYGLLSDYGRCYVRPLLLLAATVIVGTFLFAVGRVGFWTPVQPADWGRALKISFASTFNVVLGRTPVTLIEPNDLSSAGLQFVSIVQVFVGIVLLFLFGLGIRNRFRMK